ncbi:uracil-DNA glycosylase [Corynebacterium caspium]|uniref:uracil-DNA glycosylase n=1 Tax=Corynebacterium caspium TaxID=234828 RepID=UPI000365F4BB|nr:uracil-DNA glycosylase [Corynebacterium caspium]WKD59396.1 Uracil-DNA glycosylase [Corynebacterium caspium DSM 44850]
MNLAIHPSWQPILAPVENQIHQMGEFLKSEVAAGRGYLPAAPDIFKAFTYPFTEIKVLIVGQDPYPTPGHAMGLSFSTKPGIRPLPRSLSNIFKELHSDLGIQATDGDLTAWSRQGVALFNRVLTVTPGKPASHRGKGWELVTETAIRALANRPGKPLVAILWGRDAQTTAAFLGDCPRIESPHPSPLSASRGFFGSKPFSRTNQILTDLGTTPVNWQL